MLAFIDADPRRYSEYGKTPVLVEAENGFQRYSDWAQDEFDKECGIIEELLSEAGIYVPNFGDMTKYKEWNLNEKSIDLLVGGTPCQSFSISGLRKGLGDERGNLMLEYLRMADEFKPKWIVWENVVGVLSSNGGRDFGTFLTALGKIGYGFAYRVLDAQYFGVPQRRRRVFVVGCLGDWRSAGKVLFESESLVGHGHYSEKNDIASTVRARDYKDASDLITFSPQNSASNGLSVSKHTVPTLQTTKQSAVAIPIHDQATRHSGKRGEKRDGKGNGLGIGKDGAPMNTLTRGDRHAVSYDMKKLKYDGSEDIDLGLLISVCSQIQEDVQNKDYTAIENLFQYLDDPEDRLKGFLRDD
eukprot:gene1753-12351_t